MFRSIINSLNNYTRIDFSFARPLLQELPTTWKL